MNSMLKAVLKMAVAIVLAAVMVGCEGDPLSTREKATLVGGGLGAATGTIIGSAVGSPGAGAAIGGALGAGTGFLAGNEMQNEEAHQRWLEDELSQQQAELERQRREIERLKWETEYD